MVLSGLLSGSKVLVMYLFHSLVSFSSGMLNSFRISFSIMSAVNTTKGILCHSTPVRAAVGVGVGVPEPVPALRLRQEFIQGKSNTSMIDSPLSGGQKLEDHTHTHTHTGKTCKTTQKSPIQGNQTFLRGTSPLLTVLKRKRRDECERLNV